MLKFVLMTFMMTLSLNSWLSINLSLFLASFVFGLFSLSTFSNFQFGYGLGLDWVGYLLILLSIWILALVVSASEAVKEKSSYVSLFLMINLLLLLTLIMTFSCLDYFLFYVCFESSLIPIMILILGWGYQPERMQAGVYMLFYTLFASLPLLISFFKLYSSGGTLVMGLSSISSLSTSLVSVWYLCSVMAFVVKLPMYLVHLWLPKAHVEAPVAGSMILAGVLLKLGGYGLIRVCPLFSSVGVMYSWVWVGLGLVGSVIVSLICMRQSDMKSLIAYSSVAHMGLVLVGLMLFSWWGLCGAVVVMVGHGLCSSGLFCLANMSYERLGSRSMFISKGLLNFMPTLALWWFALSAGNMAAPPTLNLLGEISLIVGVLSWSSVSAFMVGLLSFFSAAYTLYLFSLSQHGKYFSSVFSCTSGEVREYLVLMLHWLPLNSLILVGYLSVA
nr:NADH dehydrogenase subunit 4 [Palaemon elegans]